MSDHESDYDVFHREAEPRLRRALVAAFGPERGREATADALAYGWEHWDRVRSMDNPMGYLYRVGERRARRAGAINRVGFPPPPDREPSYEPGLPAALDRLSPTQRQAVLLVYGWGYPHREVATLLGVAPSTIQTHLERGLAKLRAALGVTADA